MERRRSRKRGPFDQKRREERRGGHGALAFKALPDLDLLYIKSFCWGNTIGALVEGECRSRWKWRFVRPIWDITTRS
jgi:hypothetical protein